MRKWIINAAAVGGLMVLFSALGAAAMALLLYFLTWGAMGDMCWLAVRFTAAVVFLMLVGKECLDFLKTIKTE